MVRVAVIGAGVIGLSSALRVLELYPDAEVVVFADKFSPNTTTDVSAGFWEPHLLGDTPEQNIRDWSMKTFQHMTQLASTDYARYTGACVVSGYQCHEDPKEPLPFWKDLVQNFRVLEEHELKQFPDMQMGFFYTTVMLEPILYLQWLMKRFQRRGGRLKKRLIKNLSEISAEGFQVIVNCTGLGARDLVGDKSVRPVRGQVIRAKAPWVKNFIICAGKEELAYVLPSANFVVMGGVEYVDNWNLEVDRSDKKHIWDLCTKYIPSLTEAIVDSDHVGLRPSRPAVRLELQHITLNGTSVPVVHNYGHGGGGVTLHWGCAEHAAKLVKQALTDSRPVPAKL